MFSTRGIALQTVKYSDNSLIAKFYTEEFGLQSYMLRGVRSKKSKIKPSVIQHMNLFDMVVSNKEKFSLHSIAELSNQPPYITIPYDIIKSSIVLFLNEVLIKSIKEQEPNRDLYNFIQSSLIELDAATQGLTDFHINFLMSLTRYLGFYPNGIYTEKTPFFNLLDGRFVSFQDNTCLGQNESRVFSLIANTYKKNIAQESLQEKKSLLGPLLRYFEYHLEGFRNIKSHLILESVFH